MKPIQVNSEQVNSHAVNLAELLQELGYADATLATAVNVMFVATHNRHQRLISAGDQIEILAPMQGG
jgi:sulfur carrier protein